MKEFSFSDDVIANIAKTLQIAMITGTDIVDNLRMMKLTEGNSGVLEVTEGYKELLEKNVTKMMEEIENLEDNQS